jgi:hypothetical protein
MEMFFFLYFSNFFQIDVYQKKKGIALKMRIKNIIYLKIYFLPHENRKEDFINCEHIPP